MSASLLLLLCAPSDPVLAVRTALAVHALDEYDDRLRDAARDLDALWELALWCEAAERSDELVATCERILELDADHAGAHGKLRHHHYDGQWFETYRSLSAHRREEERRMLAEHGLVRFGDDWVPEGELAFARMGWERLEDGEWVSAAERARREEAERLSAEGWQQQDLVWVAPEEFDLWREGKWKCGEDWLEPAAADHYHAELAQPWIVPGEHFITRSTLEREALQWAAWWAERAYPDLVRAVGLHPERKPTLYALASAAQYNAFASGDAAAQRPAAEGAGLSSLHYAFLADSWIDLGTREFPGAGVCYWEWQNPDLAPFGQHAVRHAAALAYLEAVDPSWETVSRMLSAPPGSPVDQASFWSEKRLPRWFRYGVASYCERFFVDHEAGEDGDPLWARQWALANLRRVGGLTDADALFAFELDPADDVQGGALIHGAGLLVAWMLDGESRETQSAHRALKLALREGGDTEQALTALEQALRDDWDAIERWAEL